MESACWSERECRYVKLNDQNHLNTTYSSLGELCSGPVTDAMMQKARKRALKNNEIAPPEVRLQGIWTGAATVPIGLMM